PKGSVDAQPDSPFLSAQVGPIKGAKGRKIIPGALLRISGRIRIFGMKKHVVYIKGRVLLPDTNEGGGIIPDRRGVPHARHDRFSAGLRVSRETINPEAFRTGRPNAKERKSTY